MILANSNPPWPAPQLPVKLPPLKKFKADDVAYLRVQIVGPYEGFDGEAKVLVNVVDRFLRPQACCLVDESQLIALAYLKSKGIEA